MKHLYLILFLVSFNAAYAQTVSTITEGDPDDAIAIDSNSNIYSSGFNNATVYRFTPDGSMTEFITGLSNPNGIAFNSLDEIYVCQWGANLITRYNISGDLLNSYSQLGNPSGMIKSFDNDDMIFTKYSGNSIHRLTPQGDVTTISSDSQLNGPVGLAYDESGTLYVGNYNDRKIYRVLSDGQLDYIATVGNNSNLGFIAYAQGYLWGTVLNENKIYKINPSDIDVVELFAGSNLGNADGDISEATFSAPNGIAFNESGDTMYVSEFGAKNLRTISGINLSVNDYIIDTTIKIIKKPKDNLITIIGSLPSQDSQYNILMTNIIGQKVLELKNRINSGSEIREHLNITGLENGSYFINIRSKNFNETKRIIID